MKRRHHYVWRHYLDAWASSGKIWCLRRGGQAFRVSTKNVAIETDFYRLRDMTARDREFVISLIEGMEPPFVRNLATGWVPMFYEIPKLMRMVESSGELLPQERSVLDVERNNLEEDLHAKIESDAVPLLRSLREGKTDVLESDVGFRTFSLFLVTQHLRTRRMRDHAQRKLQRDGFNIGATWGLIRTVLATSLSYNLSANRAAMRAEILEAPAPAEFLAGDQPLFNVRAVGKAKDTPLAELTFYYPLSPSKALLLDFDASQPGTYTRALSRIEIATYNWMMTQESHEQVFASTKRTLEEDAPSY